MRLSLLLVFGFLLSLSIPSIAAAGTLRCRSTSHPKVRMTSWSKSGGARPYPGMVVGGATWYYGKKVIGGRVWRAGARTSLGPNLTSKRKPPTIQVRWHYKTRRVIKSGPRNRMVVKQTYTITATIKSLVRKRLHPKLPKGAVRLKLRCHSVQHYGMP